MATDRQPVINMSRIPVAGIGGLGLVGTALVAAWVLPGGRSFLFFSVFGGLILACALVLAHRVWHPHHPTGDDPFVLFPAHDRAAVTAPDEDRESGSIRGCAEQPFSWLPRSLRFQPARVRRGPSSPSIEAPAAS
jgi:hypothetical protein